MTVKLRDYQIKGIEDILDAWKDYKSVLFQMPTGTGKTTLFCELARKFITEFFPDKKVLIVTHRRELVEQAFSRLVEDFRMTAGIISSNYIGIESSPIQVASIQTLIRRKRYQLDMFSLVIIDEAHHALASTYKKLWSFYPGSKFLGVTATPVRTNGEGFRDLFDILITTPSVKWFIKENYLADVRYYASHSPDLTELKIKVGDYDETELSEVMQADSIMADLVKSYTDFAPGKKMIVYAVNRAHCRKIVEKFNNSGFLAKAIDTFTSSEERKAIVEEFRKNEFKILCNVNIFSEGFDCPDVDVVQLARPTKSLTLFLQQVGRCLRPHPNKSYGIVLDNAGLWKEHGLPKMQRKWCLDGVDSFSFSSRNSIVGIRPEYTRENVLPEESTAIQLMEIGEVEGIADEKLIHFNDIEKTLIDSKAITMKERYQEISKQILEIEKRIDSEDEGFFKEILIRELEVRQKELVELQEELRPARFEQVLELILTSCRNIIDTNDIFIEDDRDEFLRCFIPPSLEEVGTKRMKQSNSYENPNFTSPKPKIVSENSEFKIYHRFPSIEKRAVAVFNRNTSRIKYNNEENLSPSSAASKANYDFTGRKTSLNGWKFWNYVDDGGVEREISDLRLGKS